jgi:type I restriction enzyme, S subunit
MSDWYQSTLGQVCDEVNGLIQTGPFGSQLHQSDYTEHGVPVVMPKDIVGGRITSETVARVSVDHVDRLSRHKLNSGDIIYGRRGDIGRQALIRSDQAGWICGTGCLRISLGESNLDPLFLHYYLSQDEVISWITNQAVGATMPNLNTAILRSVPVRYPDLPVQRRIAGILSAYDDLIENSQRRIRILEEMARRLYREWFVHFRFPGHEDCLLVESPLGEIPEGWEVASFGELYNTGSGGTPSRANPEYYENGTVDWVKSKELIDGFVLSAEERITEAALKMSSAKLFPANTVLIALYGATIGKLAILSCPAATNQACCAILPKHSAFGREFAFLTLLLNRERIIGMRLGAAQQNISQVLLRNFECLKPPTELLRLFSDQTAPFFDQTLALQHQIQNLCRTRDLLLPRLLSGQIEVEAMPEPSKP